MSTAEKWFTVVIRIVFVFAFGAFLWASLHHIAAFFHEFEPENMDWSGSYALAISVDGTALMLTIGMMFFSRNKPLGIKTLVWFFIISLTGFSWVVNWEYATRFQASDFTHNPTLVWLNPILASSFAFLNLAYSIVAELFGAEEKTPEQLQAEITALDARSTLEKQLKNRQGPGLIQQTKQTLLEAKKAAKEVLHNDEKIVTTVPLLAAENTPRIVAENLEVSQPEIQEEMLENLPENTPVFLPEILLIEKSKTPEVFAAKLPENTPVSQSGNTPEIAPEKGELSETEKLELTVAFLTEYPTGTDEELAEFLTLRRPAAARFWRLKALEVLAKNPTQKRTTDPLQNMSEVSAKSASVSEQKIVRKTEPETDPNLAAMQEKKDEKNRSQIRYTPAEAAQLDCCVRKGIISGDIRSAIKAGNLEKKPDGKLSKSSVETWAKSYQKETVKQSA